MWIKINIDVIFINAFYLNLFIKHDMEGANVISNLMLKTSLEELMPLFF